MTATYTSPRCGQIGEPQREITWEPLPESEPLTVPEEAPEEVPA